jgi:hypothetical protein
MVDAHWAAFFVTGDASFVLRVMDGASAWANYEEFSQDGLNMDTEALSVFAEAPDAHWGQLNMACAHAARMAAWSLHANARSHDEVAHIVAAEHRRLQGMQSSGLLPSRMMPNFLSVANVDGPVDALPAPPAPATAQEGSEEEEDMFTELPDGQFPEPQGLPDGCDASLASRLHLLDALQPLL